MCRNTANNICFHYKTNSVKTNDQIFQYIQKTLFLAHFQSIFPNFGTQKFFQKIRLCQAQLHMGFWHHAQIQKKMMIQFQENTWTKVWKDRRTVRSCFIGPFRLMPRVQKECFTMITKYNVFMTIVKRVQETFTFRQFAFEQVWRLFSTRYKTFSQERCQSVLALSETAAYCPYS